MCPCFSPLKISRAFVLLFPCLTEHLVLALHDLVSLICLVDLTNSSIMFHKDGLYMLP